MRKTPKAQTAPPFLTKILAVFNPVIKEHLEVMPTYNNPYIVDHSKFQNVFGSETTPHKEAISKTVEWFKKNYPA